MAILQEGTVLTGIRGKIGTVVIYRWKDKVCARSKPATAHKKAKRSVLQQAQANKMKLLSPILNATAKFLKIGFKQRALERNITANNAAKSINLLNAIKGEFPEQEINWEAILVSDGELTKPENVKVTITSKTFHFTWDENKNIIGSQNDRAIILLYDSVQPHFHASYSGARRSELKDSISLSSYQFKGKTFEVFIAFKDVMSDQVSRSVYCGRFKT
ncbi:DUF6266 family protein [Pedobacter cryoconitis]|uniref:Uncharacterized protein n=1 Tax=Pedobacter cryoconitis TaxID=188932 RepID=A0A7X0MIC3_9SPHI|nr:DUF6266 family protein [Pedobacter cryoconitis]MBB6498380.1 hypothetical protein [Pedobacter cryoconitis]